LWAVKIYSLSWRFTVFSGYFNGSPLQHDSISVLQPSSSSEALLIFALLFIKRAASALKLTPSICALAELKRHCFFLVIYNRIVFSPLFTMAGRLTVHLACQPTQVPSIDSRLMVFNARPGSALTIWPASVIARHSLAARQFPLFPQSILEPSAHRGAGLISALHIRALADKPRASA
jgi:hypothetical protein